MLKLFATLVVATFFVASAMAVGAALIVSTMPAADEAKSLSADEQDKLNQERSLKTTRSATVVNLDANALSGNIVTVAAPDGKSLSFTKTKEEQAKGEDPDKPNPNPATIWYGVSQGGGTVSLIVRNGVVGAGIIREGATVLLIRSLGKRQMLVDFDTSSLRDHSPDSPTLKGVSK